MDVRLIVTVAAALIAVLQLPLILRRVGPNALYGFRTPRTLADRETWFAANAFAGKAFVVAMLATIAAVWLLPVGHPRSLLPVFVLTGATLAALVASMLYLRRLG